MPRKFLQRLLPAPHRVREDRSLRMFGGLLANRNLWHLHRRSVARAVSVGLFCAFLPFPGQMLVAAAAAVWLNVNLPVALVMVWITNPLTFAAIFYAAYRVGAFLLDRAPGTVPFEATLDSLLARLGEIWEPLLLGCLILGVLSAVVGNLLVHLCWRIYVTNSWRARSRRRTRAVRGRPAPRRPESIRGPSPAPSPDRE